ncbi:MAG TPA: glycosyltransferase [Gaiellaceae bacterium]|nr:glycosyltransferase [Gaiellaceae bacterium]
MSVALPSARLGDPGAALSVADRSPQAPTIGLVGTYPPTKCGIASFTASLGRALATCDTAVGVIRCVDRPSPSASPVEVVAELVRGSSASRSQAARALDRFDVVVLQHEFGIYGGTDGAEVLDLVSRSDVPLVVVLHTVLERPSWRQRHVFERLVDRADAVVAQSLAACRLLTSVYGVDPLRVEVIPHGARPNLGPSLPSVGNGAPTVITWGLIGPGKGIELGIEAMALLEDLVPQPRYLVLGQTHPKLVAAHGESYREQLVELARVLGVCDRVEFDDRYHDTQSLLGRIRASDVVLLPYRSREQVVSGVLVEAIASGKPVVATGFPHAVEVLADGSGLIVPHDDAAAIAAGLRALTEEPAALLARAAARRQAPTVYWENVARSYRSLASALASSVSRAAG